VEGVRLDLTNLLAQPLAEEDLHRLMLDEYSLFYDPWKDEISMREWLEGLLHDVTQPHRPGW
jgi:hypothetical protein